MQLPENVKEIINKITTAGYEAYAVGGCVRDMLLSRTPEDYDITTSATPKQIKMLFPRTVDTGIKHGTVTVLFKGGSYEVTTYRIDGEYLDHRHPKEVVYTSKLSEDLRRRDFTMNAMAFNDTEGLIDLYGGQQDISRKRIRCVGDPQERFSEDALRIMRAVRFSAQLGYEVEKETKEAITLLKDHLSDISAERIQTELVKLVVSPHPEYLNYAYETGITGVILPEFDRCMQTKQNNPHHCYSVGEHILYSMQQTAPDKVLRLAMLLHDIGKPDKKTTDDRGIDHFYGHQEKSVELARKILRRLKFDNDTISKVLILVRYHDVRVEETAAAVRMLMYQVGETCFPMLFPVWHADVLAQSEYYRKEKEERLDHLWTIYQGILERKECVTMKGLDIQGGDLIKELSLKEGPAIGNILQNLLLQVIREPELNRREKLLELALKFR